MDRPDISHQTLRRKYHVYIEMVNGKKQYV